jgi:hypothetical protein
MKFNYLNKYINFSQNYTKSIKNYKIPETLKLNNSYYFFLNNKKNTMNFHQNKTLKYNNKNDEQSDFKIYSLFFLFNYTLGDVQFKPHYCYNLLYLKEINNNILIVNVNKFINR